MGTAFKNSLKALEADIQLANTMALSYPRRSDGTRLQMRLSYTPAAQTFIFLFQWFDCKFAGALGLLQILIYMTYTDGKTSISVHERKASMRQFYGIIFPSLLQLQGGISEYEEKKQRQICALKYPKKDYMPQGSLSEIDLEREQECGICMEINSMIVLPSCCHSLCLKCYHDWRNRSQSCPFCRESLKRVKSSDVWEWVDSSEVVDLSIIVRQNIERLFMYIEKLPLVLPDALYSQYDRSFRGKYISQVSF